MKQPLIKYKFLENAKGLEVPHYQTEGASGMDLYAAIDAPKALDSGEIFCVPTGLAMEIESGFEAQVRPRSGLAIKFGISIVNAPGTIDCDYRGEVGVILINLGKNPFVIERGMRIAQLVIQPVCKAEVEVINDLTETSRGTGGFGHTGH